MSNLNSFLKYILHTVIGTLILGGLSFLIGLHPSWFDATIGSLVVNLYNFLVQTQSVVGYSPRR